MAYWLANEHLFCDKHNHEYNDKLYQHFRSGEGGYIDVECVTTVYMVERDPENATNDATLVPYTLCLFNKDSTRPKGINAFLDNLEIRLYKVGAELSDFTKIKDFTKGALIILTHLYEFNRYNVKLGLIREMVLNNVTNKEEPVYSFALFSNVKNFNAKNNDLFANNKSIIVNYFTLNCFKDTNSENPGFNLTLNSKVMNLKNKNAPDIADMPGGYTIRISGENVDVITVFKLKELIYTVFNVNVTKSFPSIFWRIEEDSNKGIISFHIANEGMITKEYGRDKIAIKNDENLRMNLTVNRLNKNDFRSVIQKLDSIRSDYECLENETSLLTIKRSLMKKIKKVREKLDHYDTALQVLEDL